MEIHQQRLIEAAQRLGIEVIDLSTTWRMDAVLMRFGGKSRWVFNGRIFSSLSLQADLLAANKHASKHFLEGLGIATPAGLVFDNAEKAAEPISSFLAEHMPAVCKPLEGSEGEGILMDIQAYPEVLDHWQSHRAEYGQFILEEQVGGHDLRIHAIDGKLVAACVRVPTQIQGDGMATVAELIAKKNVEIARLNPENHILVDGQVNALLTAAGMNLNSVPERGRKLRIKKVANMSQGATAVDVTEELHPRYGEWVTAIGKAMALSIFALDLIAQDHRRDPSGDAKALEINAQPAWLHHTFSEGRQHDMGALLLRHLFGIS